MDLCKEQAGMNKALPISAILFRATLYLAGNGQFPTPAEAAEGRRTAFLIRFGVDGKAGVDWSGSIEPTPGRMTGWQLDRDEVIQAASWKCFTREQNYWDTPYERR